jgi:hypothetical protein
MFAATAVLLLAGCVTQANLVSSDGKRYPMEVSQASKKLTANIDGTAYSGLYSLGSSSAVGMAGTKPVFMAGSSGNAGKAMLTAANGDFINCDFVYSGSTVIGQCKGKNGRDYTLTTE